MFSEQLAKRAAENNPIRVGIIGAGKFGAGLVAQLSQMKGVQASIIADINLDRAKHAYTSSKVPAEAIQTAKNRDEIHRAIQSGKPAVTEDGLLVAHSDVVDVVVEVTGVPEVGARMAYEALTHRKHVVMVNVEADVTVGPLLRRLADSAGVVYSLVDGDQPGCTMKIIDWARALGFEIVAAGRGTVFFDDDRMGIPDTVPQRFGFSDEMIARRTINFKMYNSFRDGSKAQIEMTALANMAGLVPDVRGMHEPSLNIEDIARVFSLKEEGGILNRHGVVELANSVAEDGKTLLSNPLKMGVFVVARTEHPFTQEDLADYIGRMGGNGKNFLLHRPYHLVAVEAPMSIAEAVLYHQPTGTPLPRPTAEVITVAKRDLKQGEQLDGSGGYTVYGLIERAELARAENLLPLGLASGIKLKQDVPQGAPISYDMVELNEDSFVLKLRRLQDATVWDC
jgi:predicted homoserine dehydrogenase-like protein